MSFRVIKGTFHVVGYSPDGDSIRFKAVNEANWALLEGKKVKLNAKKHAQLRIEAIDTLETHYGTPPQHQPVKLAEAAGDRLLELLGITDVKWNATHSKVISAKDGTEGYIITRMAEENGRPVSFVFDATAGLADSQEIFVDNALAKKSINLRMLKEGLAYPTFYDGLFYDLREQFAKTTQKTRKKRKGVWGADKTNTFIKINSLPDVTETFVLLPKLFRRIVAFITEAGAFDAKQFLDYLKKHPERILVLSKLHFTHFDNVFEVDTSGQIRMTELPEDLVFLAE
jgi:endonuclease YncB( thermonuclease family)